MTKTVWKFPFSLSNEVEIGMPAGARVVHVAAQDSVPCLWAVVDPEAAVETRHFRVYGTGEPIQRVESMRHVGTFPDGPFIWHVFEKARYFDAEEFSHDLDVKARRRNK